MNRICNTCNIETDANKYLKDRIVSKSRYNKNRRKNINNTLIQNQKSKINNNNDNNPNVSTYQNHVYVVIGPKNVGKTYYMLKMLEKIGNKRPIHIITRSPNEYPNYKKGNEIKRKNKNKGSIVIFDDMLGAWNSSQINEFFTRGRHEDLSVFYVSQSYFGLPTQSIKNNSDRLILFKQTFGDL